MNDTFESPDTEQTAPTPTPTSRSGGRRRPPSASLPTGVVTRNSQNGEVDVNWRKLAPIVMVVAVVGVGCCRAVAMTRPETAPKSTNTNAAKRPGEPVAAAQAVRLDPGNAAYGSSTLRTKEEEPEPAVETPSNTNAAPPVPERKPTAPVDYDEPTDLRIAPADESNEAPGELAAESAVTLPVHTRIRARLVGSINSAYTGAVTAELVEPVTTAGATILPAGTRFEGQADAHTEAKRIYVVFASAVLPDGRTVPLHAEAQETDMTTGLVADREHKNRTQSYLGAFARGALRRGAAIGNTVTGGAVGDAGQLGTREVSEATAPRRTYEVFAGRPLLICLIAAATVPAVDTAEAREADDAP